jgi:dUTP pyrophosphatase
MNCWIDLMRLDRNDLPIPKVSTKYSAGLDFAACLTRDGFVIKNGEKQAYTTHGPLEKPSISVLPHQTVLIPLGFKCQFNEECVLQLFIRSSVAVAGLMLANSTAIIDSDYRGEIFACLYNRLSETITIEHGQRIVQGMLIRLEQPIINEVAILSDTSRGDGGFGSTGKS